MLERMMLFPLQLVFSGSSGPQATEAESSSCHDETNNGFMEPGQGAPRAKLTGG